MTEKIATVNLENYTQRNYHTKMSKTGIFRQKKWRKFILAELLWRNYQRIYFMKKDNGPRNKCKKWWAEVDGIAGVFGFHI